jgi:YD repeat-containing protein
VRAIDRKANLATDYAYWAAGENQHTGLLKQVTSNIPVDANGNGPASAGDRPWTITYGRQAIDRGNGRVAKVGRTVPTSGGDQLAETSLRWFIKRTVADGGPYDLKWADTGQQDLPVEGTAIVPPGAQTWELNKAAISYYNPAGRIVNTAAPGGRISTTEYDVRGNVVRVLSAGNRARALARPAGERVSAALRWSKLSQWCTTGPGSRLVAEWGPEHKVTLPNNGGEKAVRAEKAYTYDETYNGGACPAEAGTAPEENTKHYALQTEVKATARITEGLVNGGAEAIPGKEPGLWRLVSGVAGSDSQRTTMTYDAKWLAPATTTVDAGGLGLLSRTVYDAESGAVIEQRMPRSDTSDTPSTRLTRYYSATGTGGQANCVQPEWAGLVCEVKQGGVASTTKLPTTRYEYDVYGRPTVTRQFTDPDSLAAPTRTTSTTYEADGQVKTQSVDTPGVSGDADIPTITNDYDAKRRLTTTADGSRTITRAYDAIGRAVSYTDASGAVSTTTFDIRGRAVQSSETVPGGSAKTRANTYDAVTGDVASVVDSDLGTITAQYDADGQLTGQTFGAANVVLSMSFNELGKPVERKYQKGTSVWHSSTAKYSIYGQQLEIDGKTGGQPAEKQTFRYDNAGRLTQTEDTADSKCRQYAYASADGRNGNRTGLTTRPLTAGGACDTGAAGSTVSYAYDAADRLLRTTRGSTSTPDYQYDKLGRTVVHPTTGAPSVPAADAGGSGLSMSYYENDLVRSMTQANRTTTIALDPGLRPLTRTVDSPASLTTSFYGGDDDEPIATKAGSTVTREIEGLDGDLAAVKAGAAATKLQVSNLHGDVVSEADVSAAALSTAWGTDEFGVPRASDPAGSLRVVSTSVAARTTGGNNLTVGRPAEAKAGDVLVAEIVSANSNTITAPAGWTAVPGGEAVNNSVRVKVFTRVATGSDPASYAFTFDGLGRHLGGIKAVRGADTAAPVNAAGARAGYGSGALTGASVTPTKDGSLMSAVTGVQDGDGDGGGALGFSSPFAENWDVSTGKTGTERSGASATRMLQAANVASGTFSVENQTSYYSGR